MKKDKGLERELKDAGLPSAGDKPFILTQEPARLLGAACHDCGSRRVVMLIAAPFAGAFEPGAYCYAHLLRRCRASHMIPFPIELELLNSLKRDMGIPLAQAPTLKFKT